MNEIGAPLGVGAQVSGTLSGLHMQAQAAASSTGLHTVGRSLAETASEHAEHLDFFSENSIGACVACSLSLVIWLVFMPIFHMAALPWMQDWDAVQLITLPVYMARAQETFATPKEAFSVLDANADGNSTQKEFAAGSAIFHKPPFEFPADMYPIFTAIDTNQDGLIQRPEFYYATPGGDALKWHLNMTGFKARAQQSSGSLESYYKAMDSDSDGKVDIKEFVAMAGSLKPPVPETDAKAFFKKSDKDGKGFVEPREWVAYNVSGRFNFQTSLKPSMSPAGTRVKVAAEAGLRSAVQVMQFDLLTINKVSDVTGTPGATIGAGGGGDSPSTTSAPGLYEGKLNVVILKVDFTILVGTRSRQSLVKSQVDPLPNNLFVAGFANWIGGGSTTLPAGTLTSLAAQKAGPLSALELKAYLEVPAIIQGRTELLLSQAKADGTEVSKQEEKLKPLFKSSFDTFCKCDIKVDSVQTIEMQDVGGKGLATTKTMIFSWSIDLSRGGKFEKNVQDNGRQLMQGIYANMLQAKLPFLQGVSLDSWTRFSATYYGNAAANLPRGTTLKQYTGHHYGKNGMRNDTSASPFVEKPATETS